MIRYTLLATYSILFTLYIGVFGAYSLDFSGQILYVIGAFLIALSAGSYLFLKTDKGTLFGLIGIGLISGRVFAPWLSLSLIFGEDIRFLLFLLPGLAAFFVYYVLIKAFFNDSWNGLEFVSIELNRNTKKYLFIAPMIINCVIISLLVFL